MKRNLAEYSSDLDRSSSLEPGDDQTFPIEKRACSEEAIAATCARSISVSSSRLTSSEYGSREQRIFTQVLTPPGQTLMLEAEKLHPSILSTDPSFYEYSIFHFDCTVQPCGRRHFEQWAASLGDDLARYVRRLRFTVAISPRGDVEVPHEIDILVERGALACDVPDMVLRKKLARVDEQCVGAGFGVNGLIAIGRAIL